MSDEKRRELIAAGRLREDGTRIERCPVCGQDLPEGTTLAVGDGDANAEPDAVAMGTSTGEVTP
jgi:hypothetical protein